MRLNRRDENTLREVTNMKAIVYKKYGPPEVLQLDEVEKPIPSDYEVLIRIHAATVTAGDCELRSFRFPWWFWLPFRIYMGFLRPSRANILGQEMAGEVEAIGKKVTRFKIGDHVFAPTGIKFSAHAEYICLPEEQHGMSGALAIKPISMSFEEAAAVPTGGLNALHYIRRANIQKGDKVLICGASGNIGTFAVQLAKVFGAEVTGVCGTRNMDMVRSIGADKVIDYSREDFSKSGEKYDVIFDTAGKCSYSACVRSLNKNGRLLLANPKFTQMVRSTWTPLLSGKKVLFAFANYRTADLNFLTELIEAGKLKTVIDKRYPLEQTAEAHRYVDSGQKRGNIIITI